MSKNETKFTPGPWRSLGPQEVNGPIGIVKDTEISNVKCTFDVAVAFRASKGTKYGGLEEAEANAALISAAPDLYKSVQDLLLVVGNQKTDGGKLIVEAAWAILAKARGES